eukprot:6171994-Pleurochrysis_carterae.AAC.2
MGLLKPDCAYRGVLRCKALTIRSDLLGHHAPHLPARPCRPRSLARHANASLDFVAAYLQGELQSGEILYCHTPPSATRLFYITRGRPTPVCRVEKPVSGIAQAGRRWQRPLFPWLREWGFKQCKSDPCVFVDERDIRGVRQRVILGCYVDDLSTLYTHDSPDSLYDVFTYDLA